MIWPYYYTGIMMMVLVVRERYSSDTGSHFSHQIVVTILFSVWLPPTTLEPKQLLYSTGYSTVTN